MSGYKDSKFDEKEFDKMGLKYLEKIKFEKLKCSRAARRMAQITKWAIRVVTVLLILACAWQLAEIRGALKPRVAHGQRLLSSSFAPESECIMLLKYGVSA
ncbi:unnamed protein product [Ilex paraguariensis]|uniref:Uncharacterized protein n=1 Tax=Ilex paraguariensis TaxID=185542 RepID=A0ABC8RBX1_9AQUA